MRSTDFSAVKNALINIMYRADHFDDAAESIINFFVERYGKDPSRLMAELSQENRHIVKYEDEDEPWTSGHPRHGKFDGMYY